MSEGLKGKQLTLGAKLVAAAIVIISYGAKAAGFAPTLNVDDAIKIAAFVAVIFVPVDASLWVKTFFEGRSSSGNVLSAASRSTISSSGEPAGEEREVPHG